MGRTANLHHVEFLVPLPKVIGCDFSGTVISTSELPDEKKEASAANDDRLRVGDKVIGTAQMKIVHHDFNFYLSLCQA